MSRYLLALQFASISSCSALKCRRDIGKSTRYNSALGHCNEERYTAPHQYAVFEERFVEASPEEIDTDHADFSSEVHTRATCIHLWRQPAN
ncbi:hypothetical protein V8C42DRAFT_325709 [Trichoderma barbatum]